jgi:hypothetical protein
VSAAQKAAAAAAVPQATVPPQQPAEGAICWSVAEPEAGSRKADPGSTAAIADSGHAAPDESPQPAVLAVSEAVELPVSVKPQPESRLTLLLGALREQAARLEQLLGRLAELVQSLTVPER